MLLKIKDRTTTKTKSLTLSGVMDYSTIGEFEKSTRQFEGISKLIIDFKEIRFIDSTGIYVLAQVINRCQENGVIIEVQNISKPIFEILDILGLITTFGSKVFSLSEQL